jgi:hypothetical protein
MAQSQNCLPRFASPSNGSSFGGFAVAADCLSTCAEIQDGVERNLIAFGIATLARLDQFNGIACSCGVNQNNNLILKGGIEEVSMHSQILASNLLFEDDYRVRFFPRRQI